MLDCLSIANNPHTGIIRVSHWLEIRTQKEGWILPARTIERFEWNWKTDLCPFLDFVRFRIERLVV